MPMTLAGIAGLGPWELVIILAIVLVVFGAGKLPQIGGSLGHAIKNFKKGMKGEEDKNDKTK
jgi:sec-independent protein translocase protein TatA